MPELSKSFDSEQLNFTFLNERESFEAENIIGNIHMNQNDKENDNMSVLDICTMTVGFIDQLSNKFGPKTVLSPMFDKCF